MKLLSNGGGRVPFGHLLLVNEASYARIGLHLIELLSKRGPMEILQTTQVCCPKTIGCSLQTNNKSPLMKAPTQLMNREKLSWYLHRAFTTTC